MNEKQKDPNVLEYIVVIIMIIVSTIGVLFGKVILPKNE